MSRQFSGANEDEGFIFSPVQLAWGKSKPDPYFTARYDLHTKGIKSSVDPKASCIQRAIRYEIKSCE